MQQRNLPSDAAGNPKLSAQRDLTDAHSHIIKGSDGWIQGYNSRASVDGDHQVNMASAVTNQVSDAVHPLTMLE